MRDRGQAVWVVVSTGSIVRFACFFFFSSRRRHTRSDRDWSSDVCSSDLMADHGVSTRYIHNLAALGYERLAAEDLVRAADHGVSSEFAAQVQASYGRLPLEIGRASCRERV